jgi:DNA-binding LacI/PurR family transcriptional regulator
MGVVAVTMLLERMRDLDGPAHRQVFETSLVTRKSTGLVREG